MGGGQVGQVCVGTGGEEKVETRLISCFLIVIWSGEQAGLFHRGRVDEELGSA